MHKKSLSDFEFERFRSGERWVRDIVSLLAAMPPMAKADNVAVNLAKHLGAEDIGFASAAICSWSGFGQSEEILQQGRKRGHVFNLVDGAAHYARSSMGYDLPESVDVGLIIDSVLT